MKIAVTHQFPAHEDLSSHLMKFSDRLRSYLDQGWEISGPTSSTSISTSEGEMLVVSQSLVTKVDR